jgi:hypothetical protein
MHQPSSRHCRPIFLNRFGHLYLPRFRLVCSAAVATRSSVLLRLDYGRSRDSPILPRNPKRGVLYLVLAQGVISKGEYWTCETRRWYLVWYL